MSRERSKSAETLPQQAAVVAVITAIAVALASLVVIDSVMIFGVLVLHVAPLRIFLILHGEFLFTLAIVAVFWSVRRLGWQGLAVALAALAVAFAAFVSFRGSWVWTGFFDRYESSRGEWNLACEAGVALGCLLLAVYSRLNHKDRQPVRAAEASVIVLAVATVWSFVEPNVVEIDSAFAPTRFIPLGLATLLLGVLYLVRERWI